MTRRDWRNYVLGHSTKGEDAKKSESIIREWIEAYAKEANATIAALETMESNPADQTHNGKIEMLLKRWKQISGLCEQAMEAVSC